MDNPEGKGNSASEHVYVEPLRGYVYVNSTARSNSNAMVCYWKTVKDRSVGLTRTVYGTVQVPIVRTFRGNEGETDVGECAPSVVTG